jgi:transcriptional regulator with XRE-family HTH domain
MARTAVGWGVRDLAHAANVSPDTVSRFERGEILRDRTLTVLRVAFEVAGIEFIPNGVIVHAAGREPKTE